MSRRVTLVDLVGVTVLVLVAVSLLSMSVARLRASARMESCANNLKQLGLGFHNYHSAYGELPFGSGGTASGSEAEPTRGNAHRLSGLVGLTPFIENQVLWQTLSNPLTQNGVDFPAMGPVPWYPPEKYSPWSLRPAAFVCPDDPAQEENKVASSYLLNYGDAIENIGAAWEAAQPPYGDSKHTARGVFARQHPIRFRDVLDGLSYTVMLSEGRLSGERVAKHVMGMIDDPSRCIAAHEEAATEFWDDPRPAVWVDGSLLSIGFQTILPPNSPSCTSDKGVLEGVMSASSHHGGVHVLMSDGRVAFVSNSIDAGQANRPSLTRDDHEYGKPVNSDLRSPYGVWGALGTRAGIETVDLKVLQPPHRSFTPSQLKEMASFPLEIWHEAKGGGSFEARQVDFEESVLVLLLPDGKVRRIELSKLDRKDVYRALRTKQDRLAKMMDPFVEDMKTALSYLETKEFEKFMDDCVVPSESVDRDEDSRRKQIAQLAIFRGRLILALDQVIAMAPSQQAVWATQVKMNQLSLNYQGAGDELRLRLSGGHWKIVME